MKKLILFLLLLLPIPASAQVSTTTPNLGLTKPCVAGDPGCAPSGDPNWGPKINGNFDILDARVPKPTPARVTVATKPSNPTLNEIIVVTDGLGATDCNIAGGSNNVTCQWTGTAWVPVGGGSGGGGGGGGSFSGITSGSNTTATMVVGSGASLATSGTGTIAATSVPLAGITGATSLVKNNQSNTILTGDQSFAAAQSFTFPIATGATPTASGRCAYDSTANRLKCGFNGTTVTLAILTEVQPLSSGLTQLAGLSPTASQSIVHNGTNWATINFPNCLDTVGQHWNYDSSTRTIICGNSGGGSLSGGTTGALLKYSSPTSATPSIITEAAGVATVGGGLVVGTGPYLSLNTVALTADRAWTVQDVAGTVVPCTGAFTNGNIVKFSVTAGVTTCIDGGPAGTGTASDSSVKNFTNLTLDAEGTGNVITIPFTKWIRVVACQAGTASHILDVPSSNAPAAVCDATDATLGTADFDDSTDESLDFDERLPSDFTGSIDVIFRWKAAATSGTVGWCLQTARTPDGATSSTSFAAQAAGNCVSDTAKGTTLQENDATITGVTCTSCAAGDRVKFRISRDANGSAVTDSMTGDAKLIGIELKYRRAL